MRTIAFRNVAFVRIVQFLGESCWILAENASFILSSEVEEEIIV